MYTTYQGIIRDIEIVGAKEDIRVIRNRSVSSRTVFLFQIVYQVRQNKPTMS